MNLKSQLSEFDKGYKYANAYYPKRGTKAPSGRTLNRGKMLCSARSCKIVLKSEQAVSYIAMIE